MKIKHILLTMNYSLAEILEKFKGEYHLTIDQVSAILEWTPRTYSNYKNGSSKGNNPRVIEHVKRKFEAVKHYLKENPTHTVDEYLERQNPPTKNKHENTTIASQQLTIEMLVSQQNQLIHQHQQLIDKLLSYDLSLPFGVNTEKTNLKARV